ncbi:MAG: AAA family ATPase [Oscillospiraceae bacterium]
MTLNLADMTPAERRRMVEALAEEGVLSEHHIRMLSYLKDDLALLQASISMQTDGQDTFESCMARYELERESADEVRIELLEKMLRLSYHRQYMIELGGLYCSRGTEGIVRARRTCTRMMNHFRYGVDANAAEELLRLLDNGDTAQARKKYGSYAAPSGDWAVVADTKRTMETKLVPAETPQDPKGGLRLPPELAGEFKNLVGLDAVKEQMLKLYFTLDLERKRAENGTLGGAKKIGHHFVLYGNPGTGKTTVARIIAHLLHSMGILETENVVETDRSGLVSQYIGGTAQMTMEKLDAAKGGVLFIDEAYSLYRKDSSRDTGTEAIDTLLKYMEDHRSELTVIIAGYDQQMHEMLREANPGFSSRFNHQLTLPDYSDTELLEIAGRQAATMQYYLPEKTQAAFSRRIVQERVGDNFGNARTVRTLMEEAVANLALRVAHIQRPTKSDLMTMEPGDFEKADQGGVSTEKLMDELGSLTGLESVKAQVASMVKTIKAEELDRQMGIVRGGEAASLHTLFIGNPGTGKTTVARLLGKIYRALGVLKRGDVFVECGRADLVGSHQGETALKTRSLVQQALGGILFVDEAYSLCTGDNDNVGHEAVDTLIAEMENRRDSLMVIFAGYTEEMEAFLSSNPGLRSRVPTTLTFEDYTTEELLNIFRLNLERKSFFLPTGWQEKVRPVLEARVAKDGRSFANARGVRTMTDETVRRRNGRVVDASDRGERFSTESLYRILPEDFPEQ